ncbi:MAG: hypothetical protein ABI836_14050, partial [Gemmatimonadota bacterium]
AFMDALNDRGFTTAMVGAAAAGSPGAARWRILALAAGGLAATLAALALWGWFRPAPLKPVIRYSMAFQPDQAMRQGIAGVNIAISPDGKRIVYSGPGEGGGQLWLRERDRLDAVPIPGTTGASNPFFSPDGERIAYSAGTMFALTVVPVAGGPPITLDRGAVGAGGGGAWGPDGWIYFDTPAGTARIRADGGTSELLIPYDSAAHEIGFAWTEALPNGKGLVFRARRNLDPGDFDISAFDLRTRTRHFLTKGLVARYVAPGFLIVLRADGAVLAAPFDQGALKLTGPAVPLFSGVMIKPLGSADLAVSRAGALAYVPGTGTPAGGFAELVTVDRAGHVTPFDPAITINPSTNRGLSLSPDGRRVALDQLGTASPDIWVKQLPNGALSRLTFDSIGAVRPEWSVDGRDVIYMSSASGKSTVWRRRADGSAPPQLVWEDPRWSVQSGSLSRDGQWLVYRVTVAGGNRDIYAIHLGHDSVPIPLLTSASFEDAPALSPSGRWLAYTSNESGRDEIFVRPFPNISDGRWQISTAGGAAARWSHEGRELFFQNANSDLMSVTVTPGPTFVPSEPHRVFANTMGLAPSVFIPYYAAFPGDQKFLMVRLATAGQATGGGQVVMVDNWTTELAAKMKGH